MGTKRWQGGTDTAWSTAATNVKAGVQYSLNNSGDLTTGTLNGNYSY